MELNFLNLRNVPKGLLKFKFLIKYKYQIALSLALIILGSLKARYMFTPAEGWWNAYARFIADGEVPYRDFNLLVPPGMPYLTWICTAVLGNNFLNFRLVGVAFSACLGLGLFALLQRITNSIRSATLSFLAVVLLYSSAAPLPFDYNYFALGFLIFACVFLDKSSPNEEDVRNESKNISKFPLLSGFCIFISLMFKLNFAIFFILFYLMTQSRNLVKNGVKGIGGEFPLFLLGLVAPTTIYICYLYFTDSLSAFIQNIIIDAPAAKGNSQGNFSNSLFRWIKNLFTQNSLHNQFLFLLTISFLILSIRSIYLLYLKENSRARAADFTLRFGALCILVNSIFFTYSYIKYGKPLYFSHLSNSVTNFVLSWTYFLPIIMIIAIFLATLIKPLNQPILLWLSMSVIFCDGSSGGIDWYGAAIPLVYLIGLVCERYLPFSFFDSFILIFACFLAVGVTSKWADNTYNWWGLNSGPSYISNTSINAGIATGIKLNASDAQVYTLVNNKIRTSGYCRDKMLAFPSVPYFILNNEGKFIDKSNAQYWFDFISQASVAKAVSALESNPPDIFVVLNLPEFVWQGHASAFNAGHEYAQRKMLALSNQLVTLGYKDFNYKLQASPGYSISIFESPRCPGE